MAIEVEGLEKLIELVEDLADVDRIKMAMGRACLLVEAAAKKNAPKDNGTLRNSIESKVDVDGKDVIGTIFTPLEYAPYVEYGTGLFAEGGGRKDVPWSYQDDKGEWHSTKGQHPQPFMRPALNDNQKRVKEILEEGILNV